MKRFEDRVEITRWYPIGPSADVNISEGMHLRVPSDVVRGPDPYPLRLVDAAGRELARGLLAASEWPDADLHVDDLQPASPPLPAPVLLPHGERTLGLRMDAGRDHVLMFEVRMFDPALGAPGGGLRGAEHLTTHECPVDVIGTAPPDSEVMVQSEVAGQRSYETHVPLPDLETVHVSVYVRFPPAELTDGTPVRFACSTWLLAVTIQ